MRRMYLQEVSRHAMTPCMDSESKQTVTEEMQSLKDKRYREAYEANGRSAMKTANALGVNLTTVYRWIWRTRKEAAK